MHMSDINAWLRSQGKVFLTVICVILMVVWFVPFDRMLDNSNVKSGTIYGKKVEGKKVLRLARTLAALQGPRQGDKYDPIAEAWQALIFVEEAKRYGIQVGDEQVADTIRTQFGESLGELLRIRQLTQGELEDAVRVILTRNELFMMVSGNVTMPKAEAWMWFSRENESVKADYVQLRVDALMPFVQADEKGMREFFEKYKEVAPTPTAANPEGYGYLVPERVKIEYILAPYGAYKAVAQVTEKQVADYYEAHKEEFRLPDAKPAEKKDEAKKDATAKADEPKKDEPAKPQYKPLAEVSAMITDRLKLDAAKGLAQAAMEDVKKEINAEIAVPFGVEQMKVADFEAMAKSKNMTYKSTDFFSAAEADQILPGTQEIRQKAFGQGTSSMKVPRGPFASRDGEFFYQIMDVQTPRPPAFETVRARVELDYRKEEALNLALQVAAKAAKAKGIAAATEIVDGELAQLAKTAAKTPSPDVKSLRMTGRTGFFDRPRTFAAYGITIAPVPLFGTQATEKLPIFAAKAFEVSGETVGIATEKSGAGMPRVFLLQRVETEPADRAKFADWQERGFLDEKRMAVVQGWMADVRRRADPSPEVRTALSKLPDWGGEQ